MIIFQICHYKLIFNGAFQNYSDLPYLTVQMEHHAAMGTSGIIFYRNVHVRQFYLFCRPTWINSFTLHYMYILVDFLNIKQMKEHRQTILNFLMGLILSQQVFVLERDLTGSWFCISWQNLSKGHNATFSKFFQNVCIIFYHFDMNRKSIHWLYLRVHVKSWSRKFMERNKYLNIRHYIFPKSIFHYLNAIVYLINIHAACEEGYTGTNCETVCVYPSYGLDCQSVCNCIVKQCDHTNGCVRHFKGTCTS